ncbi:hypothetical protein B0H21DRAFT_144843 [Amylocystis lapponica]|nr:hypothetical protein B0H21DRAFT_144843 [Amylocystis lapponica]
MLYSPSRVPVHHHASQRSAYATVPTPPLTPPPTPPPTTPSSRFAPYKEALNVLAARTRTPLPSLVLSFAILHELTAIVPLVGFFFSARALGVGERVVNAAGSIADSEQGWVAARSKEWMAEGQHWAERVGRRYGFFGFAKGAGRGDGASARLAGDVANAVVAYCLTKALLPVRIGFSLYLSPAFSRRVVEPVRISVLRPFRGKPPSA